MRIPNFGEFDPKITIYSFTFWRECCAELGNATKNNPDTGQIFLFSSRGT